MKEITKSKDWGAKGESVAPLTCPLELPSGAIVEVTRPPLDMWIASGFMPEFLVVEMMGALRPKSEEEKIEEQKRLESEMTDEEGLQFLVFMREAVRAALVRPRIVLGARGDDEIEPSKIPPDDLMWIFHWVMRGCPGVPVRTAKGGLTVEAVSNFPDKKRRKGRARARDNLREVRKTA